MFLRLWIRKQRRRQQKQKFTNFTEAKERKEKSFIQIQRVKEDWMHLKVLSVISLPFWVCCRRCRQHKSARKSCPSVVCFTGRVIEKFNQRIKLSGRCHRRRVGSETVRCTSEVGEHGDDTENNSPHSANLMVSASTDSFWTGRLHNQLYAPAKSNLICTFLDNKQERKKSFCSFRRLGSGR